MVQSIACNHMKIFPCSTLKYLKNIKFYKSKTIEVNEEIIEKNINEEENYEEDIFKEEINKDIIENENTIIKDDNISELISTSVTNSSTVYKLVSVIKAQTP